MNNLLTCVAVLVVSLQEQIPATGQHLTFLMEEVSSIIFFPPKKEPFVLLNL